MAILKVGVIGATSLVGKCLIPILIKNGIHVVAFSRKTLNANDNQITWCALSNGMSKNNDKLEFLICVAPIWTLPEYFNLLKSAGVRRVIAISSTSKFTKLDSLRIEEREIAKKIHEAELCLIEWAEKNTVQWLIFRPTLIYGFGIDKNISKLTWFIRTFHFFPLVGLGNGLRQPIHAIDVARICVNSLYSSNTFNSSFNIAGAESLTYREMASRIFESLGLRPYFIRFPVWIVKLGLTVLHINPKYRNITYSMFDRMNRDQVFDINEARKLFNFEPRKFKLSSEDL